MESDTIYEDSLAEIKRARKQLAFDTITIEVKKLDAKTKEAVIYALSAVLADREKEVTKLLTGVA